MFLIALFKSCTWGGYDLPRSTKCFVMNRGTPRRQFSMLMPLCAISDLSPPDLRQDFGSALIDAVAVVAGALVVTGRRGNCCNEYGLALLKRQ